MAFETFLEIRKKLCKNHKFVSEGKMMSSPAMHYKEKVFAFYSRKHTMVFRLGRDYPFHDLEIPLREFNPFKKRKPLTGWYETDVGYSGYWEELSLLALQLAQKKRE